MRSILSASPPRAAARSPPRTKKPTRTPHIWTCSRGRTRNRFPTEPHSLADSLPRSGALNMREAPAVFLNSTNVRRFSEETGRTRSHLDRGPLPHTESMLTCPSAEEDTGSLSPRKRRQTLLNLCAGTTVRLLAIVSLLTISGTFHSLFKVLFFFPSRYLFAIGLRPIFSVIGGLPNI
jgi:hypothetical protein